MAALVVPYLVVLALAAFHHDGGHAEIGEALHSGPAKHLVLLEHVALDADAEVVVLHHLQPNLLVHAHLKNCRVLSGPVRTVFDSRLCFFAFICAPKLVFWGREFTVHK